MSKYIKNMEFNGKQNSDIVKKYFFSSTPLWENYEAFLKELNGNE